MSAQKLVKFFKEIDKNDVASVGGKGANLGEMTQAHFPVPDGFAISVASYDIFLEQNNLRKKIHDILATLDVNQPDQLGEASRKISKVIISSEIPEEISQEVFKAYHKL